MAELSIDRKEFARLCAIEIQKAAKLSGAKMPDSDFVQVIALDMASSPGLAHVPTSKVPELFAIARAHYSETPILRHIVKAWETHMKPKQDAPMPSDAPRLMPPPSLSRIESNMRKLAAVRTCMASGGHMQIMSMAREAASCYTNVLEIEDWMNDPLMDDPSIEETRAMIAASTESSISFYLRNPGLQPCWGHWIMHYGLSSS